MIFLVILVPGLLLGSWQVSLAANALSPSRQSSVTPYDLISAMNALRISNGLPALIVDPIIMAVAQNTAEIMAASNLSWHIGNVKGRIQAAGYGGGATVWATENFAMGKSIGLDEIMYFWSDYDHMRPAIIPAYCHVGAGVAQATNGTYYYVLQAAYTDNNACGEYTSVSPGSTGDQGGTPVPMPVSQIIVPVTRSTPDADGKIYHIVKPGQSFWSIAIAYKTTIKDLEYWNNLSRNNPLNVGEKLLIPDENTAGYATPTPVWMVIPTTPDADGRIVHVVQPYHNLTNIAKAYNVPMDTILRLNGIQLDTVLQIGQKLLIYPGNITPTATPRPLTPIEKLTPAPDGRYYHTIRSGETLSWIAAYYGIPLRDLMAWNGLTANSIIRPDEKLLLQVTPPIPTETPTPLLPTSTPTATPSPSSTPTPGHTLTPSAASADPAAASSPAPAPGQSLPLDPLLIFGIALVCIGAALLLSRFLRDRDQAT